MREIKFRAWDGENKKMYVQDNLTSFHFCGGGLWACWHKWGQPDQKNVSACGGKHDFLMQYTGLKDKEGVEIYEGDIVKCRTLRASENSGGAGEVYWGNNVAGFHVKGYYETFQDCPSCAFSENMSFEVIGSIHQNPELIE